MIEKINTKLHNRFTQSRLSNKYLLHPHSQYTNNILYSINWVQVYRYSRNTTKNNNLRWKQLFGRPFTSFLLSFSPLKRFYISCTYKHVRWEKINEMPVHGVGRKVPIEHGNEIKKTQNPSNMLYGCKITEQKQSNMWV